ncbi:MAG: cell division protein FtsA [Candidatus Atribacteria bacterium]|nr:cell division protein FtsA [Candidatus Atribacteria bacterium]
MKLFKYIEKSNPTIAVVDVGTSKVCTLNGKVRSNGIEILGIGLSASSGIKKGKVVDVEKASHSIRESLLNALSVAKEQPDVLYTGIAGDYVTSKNAENEILLGKVSREVYEKDIEKVVEGTRAQIAGDGQAIIHVIPQEFSLDDQRGIAHPRKLVGTRLKVNAHVVTAEENHLHNLIECFQSAGYEVHRTVFQPYASALAVLTTGEQEAGTVLADIGGGTTDIAVFYNDSIYYSNIIPVGGELITSDLTIGLRTSRDEAERIKLQYGSVYSKYVPDDEVIEVKDISMKSLRTVKRKFACEIIEARVKEIILMLKREIRASGMAPVLRGGIVFTGGSSLLGGLSEFASSLLNMPVRIGFPESKNYLGQVQVISSPIFSTSCGLLQLALSEGQGKNLDSHFNEGSSGKIHGMINKLKDFFMMG